jgi:hypothetical protein
VNLHLQIAEQEVFGRSLEFKIFDYNIDNNIIMATYGGAIKMLEVSSCIEVSYY